MSFASIVVRTVRFLMGIAMIKLKVWIVYDEHGGIECHPAGEDEALERYDEEVGGHEIRRCVTVAIEVPSPITAIELGLIPE